MSVSQFIKDFIDALNNFYDSLSGDISLVAILQFAFSHLVESTKFLIQYLATFRWVNDFYMIKVTIPQLFNSNLTETYSLENPFFHFFSFFQVPDLIQDPLFSGLFNSFFLSLPFSSGQILWLRRLTVEGVPAGIASGAGIIVGQFFLTVCVLLGFRFIVFPWLSIEWLHCLLGLVLTLSVVYTLAYKPIKRIKYSETNQLAKIFVLHLTLTWIEQSTLFSYFSSLSFNPEPNLLEIINSDGLTQSILLYWNYILGLLIGLTCWTSFFGWLVLNLGYALSKYLNFSYSIWIRNFHFSSLTLIIAFNLTSLPYYNLDYLITSPLGFISQDKATKKFQLRTTSMDLQKGRLGEYSSHTTLDTDIAIFDRGNYLTSSEVELTFEDLNYQGEYVWRSRNDRLASGSAGIVNKLMSKFLPKLKSSPKYSPIRAPKVEEVDEVFSDPYNFADPELEIYTSIYPFFSESEDLVTRFIEDYQADVTNNSSSDSFPTIDQEAFSAFSELAQYGFDPFAAFEDVESDEYEEKLGKKIKSKYYSNPVYKFILSSDILNFLDRQPKAYSLTKNEENELFKKRMILSNYYNSLREYTAVLYSDPFHELFFGSKSYANRVYNQQFKGTLKILRRLFAISLEPKENPKQYSILKYDQPLYLEKYNKKPHLLHEELKNELYFAKPFDQSPFLKETRPIPFYAGWDEKLRKFLVTNYWLTFSNTNNRVNYLNIFESKFPPIGSNTRKIKTLYFVAWPLSKQKMEKIKYESTQPMQLLFSEFDDPANEQQLDIFEYAESDDYDIRLIYETLPSILKRVDLREKDKPQIRLQPLRGGLIWNGSEPPKIKLKEFLDFIPKIGRDWRDLNP